MTFLILSHVFHFMMVQLIPSRNGELVRAAEIRPFCGIHKSKMFGFSMEIKKEKKTATSFSFFLWRLQTHRMNSLFCTRSAREPLPTCEQTTHGVLLLDHPAQHTDSDQHLLYSVAK